jgi:hypothetical protein
VYCIVLYLPRNKQKYNRNYMDIISNFPPKAYNTTSIL